MNTKEIIKLKVENRIPYNRIVYIRVCKQMASTTHIVTIINNLLKAQS